MSRAFVNEDAAFEPEPRYALPDPGSEFYDQAAARALLDGAHAGHTLSAEKATGYAWGEPRLVPHVEALMAEAMEAGDERTVRLGRRFLRAAARDSGGS